MSYTKEWLISHLREAKKRYDAGEDQLNAMNMALRATIMFLNTASDVRKDDLAAPLSRLGNMISDIHDGTDPKRLFPRDGGKKGNPSSDSFHFVRLTVVKGMDMLVKAGMSQDKAAETISAICGQLDITQGHKTKPITAGAAEKWRSKPTPSIDAELKRLKHSVVDKATADFLNQERTIQEAIGVATEMLKACVRQGFRVKSKIPKR